MKSSLTKLYVIHVVCLPCLYRWCGYVTDIVDCHHQCQNGAHCVVSNSIGEATLTDMSDSNYCFSFFDGKTQAIILLFFPD